MAGAIGNGAVVAANQVDGKMGLVQQGGKGLAVGIFVIAGQAFLGQHPVAMAAQIGLNQLPLIALVIAAGCQENHGLPCCCGWVD